MTLNDEKATELKLVQRCLAEDPDAWNELLTSALGFLQRVVPAMMYGRLGRSAAVDDLIQDTLVLLWRYRRPQLGKYDPGRIEMETIFFRVFHKAPITPKPSTISPCC